MTDKEIIKKLNSVWLMLEVHPDNEPDSEFSDRIKDISEIMDYLGSKDKIPVSDGDE